MELRDEAWVQAVARINNVSQLSQSVHIWGLIASIDLQPDWEDAISRNWTPNGVYSAAAAYASAKCSLGLCFMGESLRPTCLRSGAGRMIQDASSA